MSKQSFCWWCGNKLQGQYYAEVADPIGNIHKVHKCCVDGAQEGFRAMPREKEHTYKGVDVRHFMDHIL